MTIVGTLGDLHPGEILDFFAHDLNSTLIRRIQFQDAALYLIRPVVHVPECNWDRNPASREQNPPVKVMRKGKDGGCFTSPGRSVK